jgi:hypothetical protein
MLIFDIECITMNVVNVITQLASHSQGVKIP